MARGTALSVLRTMLKTELGYVLSTSVAVGKDPILNGMLDQTQRWLWTQFRWPFLKTHEDINMVGNTRYYSLPTTLSLDYPTEVETKWAEIWYPVAYGISGEQYEAVDPDLNQTEDPVTRWQYDPVTGKIEVWPVPSTQQTLRFWGTKLLRPLVQDTDTADLDDLLIVLFAAAEFLARDESPDGKAKLSRAQMLFQRLKSADRRDVVFTMNGDSESSRRNRNARIITVIGNPNH